MKNRWLWMGVLVVLICAGVIVLPSLTLTAYTPDHTYVVSPTTLTLETAVGTDASGTFSVSPDQGEFTEYPVSYRVSLGQTWEDYCLEWDTDNMECIGGFDFETWANDGLLCEYLSVNQQGSDTNTLQIPNDTEDTLEVTLSVPCVGSACAIQYTWRPPFPESLLDRPLSCDIAVGEKWQVSLLAPNVAYAQTGDSIVRVTGIVHARTALPTLSLPTEGRYAGVRGVDSTGPIADRGTANEDVFTFKVIYTHPGNLPPENIRVMIDNSPTAMSLDTGATDPLLHDGDYRNGEQYVHHSTYPAAEHAFFFTAGDFVLTGTSSVGEAFSFIAGYPSIAFIPGIQASRLFKQGTFFEDQLWEPNNDGDAHALAMHGNGTSLDADLYTKPGTEGVIDEVFGFTENVYKSFLDDLDSWKNDERLIADYAVLPYDWRLAFSAILDGGKVDGTSLYYDSTYATSTPYLYQELERLAASSDTGRITIVAHSMGGLLTKKLLADLEDNPQHPYHNLLSKVDTVVLVASPQLGTPKAVSSLLHGYGQELDIPGIGWPNFAKAATLRSVAKNMPSVYTLLPSPMYFDRVRDIAQDGSALTYTAVAKGSLLHDVTTYDTMREHLTSSPYPESDDLTKRLALPVQFIDDARALHTRIDTWLPPDRNGDGVPDIQVVQIAGWGIEDTVKGVEYVQARRRVDCPSGTTGTCYEDFIDPQPILTYDGDGTVVLPSAVLMGTTTDSEKGVETWYVDMYEHNRGPTVNRSHASFFEIESVRLLVRNLIRSDMTDEPYLASSTDSFHAPDAYLRIAIHSPVDVSIFDTHGNYVGVRAATSSDLIIVDYEVPNSYYMAFGEGKYLGIPLDGEQYTVTLDGTDSGTFTLELTEERGGVEYTTRTFRDVPVTAALTAELIITTLDDEYTLSMDTNGDGTSDTTVFAQEYTPPATFSLLKGELQKLPAGVRVPLLVTVNLAEYLADHNKQKLAIRTLQLLKQEIGILSSKKTPVRKRISAEDAQRIITIVEELIGQLSVRK